MLARPDYTSNELHFERLSVPRLLERCDALLFRQDRPSGIVLLAPGRLNRGGADFVAIAKDQSAARQLSEDAVVRLSGHS